MKYYFLFTHHYGGGIAQYVFFLAARLQENGWIVRTNEPSIPSSVNIGTLSTELEHAIFRKEDEIVVHMNTLFPRQAIQPFFDLIANYRITIYATIHDISWTWRPECARRILKRTDLVIFPTEWIQRAMHHIVICNSIVADHPDIPISVECVPDHFEPPFRLLFIGNGTMEKGYLFVRRLLDHAKTPVEVHHLGETNDHPDERFISHGEYTNNEIFDRIREIRPHVCLLVSLVPETWSYTMSICLATGLPLFYHDQGAYRERIRRHRRRLICPFSINQQKIQEIAAALDEFLSSLSLLPRNAPTLPEQYEPIMTPFYQDLCK